MIDIFSIVLFHARVYSKNSYFVTLLFTSTLSMILIEYTLAEVNGATVDSQFWLTASIFGFWNLCVTAAGALNFQRHQQTLMYLINNQVNDLLSLLGLLLAPATFGLLAFPLSYTLTILITGVVQNVEAYYLLAIPLLYIGGVICSLVIACLFLMTKNAIIYEKLLVIPILIISGLLPLGSNSITNNVIFKFIVPISYPIKFFQTGDAIYLLCAFVSFGLNIILIKLLFSKVIEYAKNSALTAVV